MANFYDRSLPLSVLLRGPIRVLSVAGSARMMKRVLDVRLLLVVPEGTDPADVILFTTEALRKRILRVRDITDLYTDETIEALLTSDWYEE